MKFGFVGNAHLIAGTSESVPSILKLLEEAGIETHGNPDLYVRSYSQFGIDEARDLTARAQMHGLSERRVFVVATHSFTAEAQNALLKLLEDPPGNALFFLIVPAPATLLPTIRSRAQILELEDAKSKEGGIDAGAFLAALPAKRLEMLKPLLEKDEDEKRDLGASIAFLSSLERSLAARLKDASARTGLHAVYRARRFIADRGALQKPLLEQVALLAPRI